MLNQLGATGVLVNLFNQFALLSEQDIQSDMARKNWPVPPHTARNSAACYEVQRGQQLLEQAYVIRRRTDLAAQWELAKLNAAGLFHPLGPTVG